MRQAQRGECDPEEAWEIFSLSAAHWALLSGIGIVAAIFLDFICGDLSDDFVVFPLSVLPAFSLLSFADAVRARVMRGAEGEEEEAGKEEAGDPSLLSDRQPPDHSSRGVRSAAAGMDCGLRGRMMAT
ncbi:hypothetical protein ACIQRC_09345 [Streptomyces californicus]|uniref:hypothetical protein n=1 Tax=Streptomyces californicus TaxID=67351 RepID=UPI003825EB22